MAKKISKNDILDWSQDWGLDPENNLPFSGRAVQKFIKEAFGSKAGYFFYDTTNNKYLVFANEAAKDEYLEDTTKTELVIGSFDAPINYTAEINLTSKTYVAIALGATGNYIEFDFDTKNKNGSSVGEDVVCTYTIIRGSTKKKVTQRYRYGTHVRFNVDQYLDEGTNIITVGIVGQNTLAATTIGITYQVVNLTLTDDTDISKAYDLANGDATLSIPFTLSGYGIKKVEWYLDGEQLDFEKNIDEVVEVSSSRTKYITLSNLSRGTHQLEFLAYTVVDGENFYSPVLHRDIIVENSGIEDKSTIVALAYEKEDLSDTTITLQQYMAYNLEFAIDNPSNPVSTSVDIYLGDTKVTTLKVINNVVNTYSIVPAKTGSAAIKIVANGTEYSLRAFVEQNSIGIDEITSNLEFNFTSVGRSNSEAGKETWTDGTHNATLSGFNFNKTSGWADNRLLLQSGASIEFDYSPLENGSTSVGRTLEFEFASSNVSNDSAVICNLVDDSNGSGILITASEAKIISRGGVTLSTKYKSEENIRIAFVINKAINATNKGLVFIYINGVISGAINFGSSDDFISDKVLSFAGTSDSEVLLKQVRIYNTALSSDQLLNNYILYRDTTAEMLEVFDRNDIYEEGSVDFSPEKLQGQLPVMIITGDIPALENTTNKNLQIKVDIEYTNLQDPGKSFTIKNAAMRPQGTSSMLYPKKNFRIYTNKLDNTILTVDGKVVADRLYSFTDGAQPVDCWCLKADYAESSGSHNTGIARLWNDLLINATVDGEYVFRTEAQKKAIENDYAYDVRTTIDGFPILLFYRANKDAELIFIGKYNFNNDKSTESVFGFKGIPGFDNSKMQCWEVLNNGDALALFTNVSDFSSRWRDAYESRYPDTTNPSTSDLKTFSEWVYSMKDDSDSFATQKWDHLQIYLMAAYYVYLMRFGAVDQVVKNAMLTSEDGQHFYFINYDNDTILGLRNNGLIAFDPTIDRQSLDPDTGGLAYAYAGHDSVLWNLLEADEEFIEIVKKVDNALYEAGLRYDNIITYFDDKQSDKWNEKVYNRDAQYKYVGPYTDAGTNNLLMLQGKRQAHRRWWLSKRFSLYDSKFVSGDFKGKALEFKVINNTEPGWTFAIEAGTSMEYGFGVYNPIEAGVALNEGDIYSFTVTQTLNIGDPVRIYSAVNLRKVDLRNITARLSNIELNNVWNKALGTKLKYLILGNGRDTNEIMTSISSLAKAKRLESLQIIGFKKITYLDLTENLYLSELYADGSGLTSVDFAEGCPLEKVSFPNTLQVLNLSQHSNFPSQESFLIMEDNCPSLYSIKVTECPKLGAYYSWILYWLGSKTTADSGCTLHLDRINWTNVSEADFTKICDLKANGADVILKGKIKLSESSQELIDKITNAFGSKVFDSENELYIKAPDAVYLSGPDSIMEGETAQFTAIVFSENKGSVKYSIQSGSRTGTSIDATTGLLTTTENGASDATLTIRVAHTPTTGLVATAEKAITIKKYVYPSSVTINGDTLVNEEEKTYTRGAYDAIGSFTCEWSLSGDITSYAKVKSQDNEKCVLARTSAIAGSVEGILTLNVIRKNGAIAATATMALSMVMDGTIMTSISNEKVMAIMYQKGLCANADYMTKEEAEAVVKSDFLNGKDEDSETISPSDSIFYNTDIVSFDELKYFTGIKELPTCAFHTCKYLTSVTLQDDLTKIGDSCFANCSKLAAIDLPNTIEEICGSAFYSCSSLKTLILPEKITYVASNLCNGCSLLKSVTIPKSVDTMRSKCFYGCSKLTSVSIPSGVTVINESTFQYCSSLAQISLPNTLKEIRSYAFDGCSALESINIPSSVTSISDYAFRKCSSLASEIEIPRGVRYLNQSTFEGCSSLPSIKILGTYVQEISDMCFSGCVSLKSIYCNTPEAPRTSSHTFGNSESTYTGRNTYNTSENILYVPANSTGYDSSYWLSPLCDSTYCGFTLSQTL